MTLAVSDLRGGGTPGSAVEPGRALSHPRLRAVSLRALRRVALGNAQGCLDDYLATARKRVSTYNGAQLGEFQSTQIKVATAAARIDAARLIMRRNCIEGAGGRGALGDPGPFSRKPATAGTARSASTCARGGDADLRRRTGRRPRREERHAAAVPRGARDQRAHRLQLRCRRRELRSRVARPALREPHAL